MDVPETEKVSLFSNPIYAGIPDNEAVTVPSYVLLSADIPVIERFFGETVLEIVATFAEVAPVLDKTIFPE